MLKKNQLVLILLTLVLMLSVFYITEPWKKIKNKTPIETEVINETGRMEELQSLRVVLNEERLLQVLSLDAIISDDSKTVTEKSKALEEKHYLNGLTEKELLLEVQIINKGYRDCFVHATPLGLEITVVGNNIEKSAIKANEIIVMAINGFDKTLDNVTVNFQTSEEVMAITN